MKYPQDELSLEELIERMASLKLRIRWLHIPWREKFLIFDTRPERPVLIETRDTEVE